eukprot:augustus_masked-scaffold_17-processed-gene-6.1-mRNA-1 protein AED:1.00 eAED:1.00 QI:0/-1/0/0/-1/1/1/0/404
MEIQPGAPPVPPKVPISKGPDLLGGPRSPPSSFERPRPNVLNRVITGSGSTKDPREADTLSYSVVQDSVLDRELADQRQKDEVDFQQRKSPFAMFYKIGRKIRQKIDNTKEKLHKKNSERKVFGYKSTGEVVEESTEIETNTNFTMLQKLQQKFTQTKKNDPNYSTSPPPSPAQKPVSAVDVPNQLQAVASPRPPPPAKIPVVATPNSPNQRFANQPSMVNTKYNMISSKGAQPQVPQKKVRPNQMPQTTKNEAENLPLNILASAATIKRSKQKKKKRKLKVKNAGGKSSSGSTTEGKKDSFVEVSENVVSHLVEPTQTTESFDPSILASKNATVRKKKKKSKEDKIDDNVLPSPETQENKRVTAKDAEVEEFDASILASGATLARKKKKRKKKGGKRVTVTSI